MKQKDCANTQYFKSTAVYSLAFCFTLLLGIAHCTNEDLSFYFRKTSQELSVPTNLVALPGDEQIRLSWDVREGMNYYVYWSTRSGQGTRGIRLSNVTPPFNHTGLTSGLTYYYIVIASNGFTISLATDEVQATPMQTFTPDGFTATAGNMKVTLSWTSLPGTTYNLYRSTSLPVSTTGAPQICGTMSHLYLKNVHKS